MDIKELYKLYQQHPCITTDSRNCPEGSIFLALKGESFDGNKFALQALQKGSAYAIVDTPPSLPQGEEGLSLLRKDVKHVLTHRILRADFWLWEPAERPVLPDDYIWIKEAELDDYAKPRLIELLLESLSY